MIVCRNIFQLSWIKTMSYLICTISALFNLNKKQISTMFQYVSICFNIHGNNELQCLTFTILTWSDIWKGASLIRQLSMLYSPAPNKLFSQWNAFPHKNMYYPSISLVCLTELEMVSIYSVFLLKSSLFILIFWLLSSSVIWCDKQLAKVVRQNQRQSWAKSWFWNISF